MRYFAQGFEPSSQTNSQIKLSGYTTSPKSFVTGGEVR